MGFHPDSLPDLTGKVYIVTGGTSGIGLYTVARLAQHGAHVYLCARSHPKGETAAATITSMYPDARLSSLVMDHSSLSSVVEAANRFRSLEQKLHGLINNAGVMALPPELTKDGYDIQWQTNYIAHWVFTYHLLPTMRQTAKSLPAGSVRIVNVTSSGHYSAPQGGIDFADTSLKNASPMARYGQSKLANVLHAKTLNMQYGPGSAGDEEIWVSAVHPGLVKTGLGSAAQIPFLIRAAIAPYRLMGGELDADKGAWTSVFCAASPDMRRQDSGGYYQRIADPNGWQSAMAKDTELARKLEKWTEEEMTRGRWTE